MTRMQSGAGSASLWPSARCLGRTTIAANATMTGHTRANLGVRTPIG
jgi:hypothetical protein